MRRVLLLALIVALGLALARLSLLYVDNRWYFTPELIAGTGYKPFVTRQLAPLAAWALMRLTGADWQAAAVGVLRLAAVGWLAALYYLARAFVSERVAVAVLILAPALFAPFAVGMYLYDMPSLALLTLGLGLLTRGHWRAYLALWPVLILAHEANGFLLPVFVLEARAQSLGSRGLGLGLLWQGALWVGLRAALALRYAANPGVLANQYLGAHYLYLTKFPAAHIGVLLGLAALVGLLWWASARGVLGPRLRPLALLIPIYFFAYVFLGYPAEVRAVAGIYPAALVLLAYIGADFGRRLAEGLGRRVAVGLRAGL